MSEPFNPARYLSKLSRRVRAGDGWRTIELDYLEVKYRLLWLRSDQPDARIETKLEDFDEKTGRYLFSARVTLPSGAEATGWGSETPDDWKDACEKAETKSLGRALAALGFGTQFCEDFDFAQGNDLKVVEAPVKPVTNGAAPTETGEPIASEPQVRALISSAQRFAGCTRDEAVASLIQEYGVPPDRLTVRQANDALAALKARGASHN